MGFNYRQLGGGVIVGPTGPTGPTGPGGGSGLSDPATDVVLEGGSASSADTAPFFIDQGDASADLTTDRLNHQVGSLYHVQLSDADSTVVMSSADSNAVVLPANASIQVPVGSKVSIVQLGTGGTTVVAEDNTLVILSPAGDGCRARYSTIYALKLDLGTWILSGDLED